MSLHLLTQRVDAPCILMHCLLALHSYFAKRFQLLLTQCCETGFVDAWIAAHHHHVRHMLAATAFVVARRCARCHICTLCTMPRRLVGARYAVPLCLATKQIA